MNFGMLKNMVENLVSSYVCPFCAGKEISEKNIDIIGAAGNTVNIDMHCPTCKKHFMAKTEVIQMELGKIGIDKLQEIQKSLLALKGKLGGSLNIDTDFLGEVPEASIRDEDIMQLQKGMQEANFKVENIFKSQQDND